jgi:hypothetical protein
MSTTVTTYTSCLNNLLLCVCVCVCVCMCVCVCDASMYRRIIYFHDHDCLQETRRCARETRDNQLLWTFGTHACLRWYVAIVVIQLAVEHRVRGRWARGCRYIPSRTRTRVAREWDQAILPYAGTQRHDNILRQMIFAVVLAHFISSSDLCLAGTCIRFSHASWSKR